MKKQLKLDSFSEIMIVIKENLTILTEKTNFISNIVGFI